MLEYIPKFIPYYAVKGFLEVIKLMYKGACHSMGYSSMFLNTVNVLHLAV